MTPRKEIAAYHDGQRVASGAAADLAELFDIEISEVYKHARDETPFDVGGELYTAAYTGETVKDDPGDCWGGRRKPGHAKPEARRHKSKTLAEVVAEARAAGMGYGQYVAMMESRKGS